MATMYINCEDCRTRFKTDDSWIGYEVDCPQCGTSVQVEANKPEHSVTRKMNSDTATHIDWSENSDQASPNKPVTSHGFTYEPPVTAAPVPHLPGITDHVPASQYARGYDPVSTQLLERSTDDIPICYFVLPPEEDIGIVAFSTLKDLLEQEDLVMAVVRIKACDHVSRKADDCTVSMEIIEEDCGSRFIRLFLPILSVLFGIGACKLTVRCTLFNDEESTDFLVSVKRGFGLFGGSGDGLMEKNYQKMSDEISLHIGRIFTGKKVLNSQIYSVGKTGLMLGAVSLLPLVGAIIAPFGLIFSLIATSGILARNLPKRGLGLGGIFLSLLGIGVSYLFLRLLGMS